MALQVTQIKYALGSLPFPLTETELERRLACLLSALPSGVEEAEVSELTSAFDYARIVNISYISALLRDICPSLVAEKARQWTRPVEFAQIRATRGEVELALLETAAQYIELTVDNAPRLRVHEIVKTEFRALLAEFGNEALSLLTPAAMQLVYGKCRLQLAERTQAQILALGCCSELRLCIESAFDDLVDLTTMPKAFHTKLLTRLLKAHFHCIAPHAKRTFQEQLASCCSGKPMDWDLTAESPQGSHLLYVASVAHALQPDAQWASDSLQRVISWERYPTTAGFDLLWQPLLEAVCRVYIGLLALPSGQVHCDPEVYLWMRRVLRKVYEYPKETGYFENRLLNVFNECAARHLKVRRQFRQNLRYCLPLAEQQPHSRQDPDFVRWVYDSVEFRYLSDSPSLSTMLHISGAKDGFAFDDWPLVTGLNVGKEVLLWRASKPPSTKKTQVTANIVALPMTLFAGWFMAVPIALKIAADTTIYLRKSINSKLRKAKNIGVYLGLLIVHRHITNRFLSLFGFCLGAQIVLSCLAEIAEFNRRNPPDKHVYITDVILLAGAVDAEEIDWELVTEAVRGRFINLYFPHNDFFNSLFGPKMRRPVGSMGICRSGIEDVDISDVLAEEMAAFNTTRKAANSFKKIAKLISYYP